MSTRDMWKMLHLLYLRGPRLSRDQIRSVGIECDGDTIYPLVMSGAVQALPEGAPLHQAQDYQLSNAAIGLLQNCLVVDRGGRWIDLRVDEPRAFVVMPFSEPWSDTVFTQLIAPAVTGAGLACVRGDTVLRTGDLTANLLREILVAGLSLVEVSVPNPNVMYELGMSHALGRDTLLLRQQGAAPLPADLAGAHYLDYTLADLDAARPALQAMLADWAGQRHAAQVAALGG